jgi:hypothetical protein
MKMWTLPAGPTVCVAHVLFGKPVPTFPGHAPDRSACKRAGRPVDAPAAHVWPETDGAISNLQLSGAMQKK